MELPIGDRFSSSGGDLPGKTHRFLDDRRAVQRRTGQFDPGRSPAPSWASRFSRSMSLADCFGKRPNWLPRGRACAPGQPALAPLVVLDLPLADLYGQHWSTGGRQTPDGTTPDEAVYLPGRNPLLLVKSRLWCQLNGVGRLALGTLKNNPFADATAEFFASFAAALDRCHVGQRGPGAAVCLLYEAGGDATRRRRAVGTDAVVFGAARRAALRPLQ